MSPAPKGTIHPKGENDMTTNSQPHKQLEEQPQLPHGVVTQCVQCECELDAMRGPAYWHGRWYCLTCFEKGRRR